MRRMRHLLLGLALWCMWSNSTAEAQHRIGTPLDAAWDYTQAQVTAGAVTRYEVQVDGGSWVNSGLPAVASAYLYRLPALTLGSHTVAVRACNASECGLDVSVTLTVIPLMPTPPTNLRIVPGTQQVSIPQAIQIAHAYSTILRLVPFTDLELAALVTRYPGPLPPTKASVLSLLDAEAIRLPALNQPVR